MKINFKVRDKFQKKITFIKDILKLIDRKDKDMNALINLNILDNL